MPVFAKYGIESNKKSKNMIFMIGNAENYNMNKFLKNCYFY